MDKQLIYQKYITHVEAVTGGGQWIDYGVLKLALRLAIDEAEALTLVATDGVCQRLRNELLQMREERDVAEKLLTELKTWQEKQVQVKTLAPLPSTPIGASMGSGALAAGGMLPGAATMPQPAAIPAVPSSAPGALTSALPVSTNGSAASDADPTPAPGWGAGHPAWEGMTEEEVVQLAALEAGAMRFGRLDRDVRIKLVGRVMGELVDIDGKLTMEEFDRRKPAWMPVATGLMMLTEGGRWGELRKLR